MFTLLVALCLAQAPARKAVPPKRPAPSQFIESSLDSTVRQRQEARAKKKRNYAAHRAAEAKRARDWQLYVERVGPVIAAQQRENWLLQMEARRTAAMEGMAVGALQEAQIARARLRLEAQQAGVPQVYVPGQGMVPYPGATVGPIP